MGEKTGRKGVERWAALVSEWMDRTASVILFLMMVLTTADVFGRKVFSDSILGTVELSEFMLALVVFFSLAHTEFMDGHVRVDLVMIQFGRRTRSTVDMITQFLCFLLCAVFTWSTLVYAGKMRLSGDVSQDLWLPKYPFVYLAVLGFAVLSLTLFVRFLASLRETLER
ncbi:MAG: TRAP transporter small permease [Deltaproteobacteria bacterium]|nr:TRAP transporter small permease [Deltaproteobacteria bacterium]